jgi:hypothetical protein
MMQLKNRRNFARCIDCKNRKREIGDDGQIFDCHQHCFYYFREKSKCERVNKKRRLDELTPDGKKKVRNLNNC